MSYKKSSQRKEGEGDIHLESIERNMTKTHLKRIAKSKFGKKD
jgi:hypothetical protein